MREYGWAETVGVVRLITRHDGNEKKLLRDFRKLLEFGTEEEFVGAMRALGLCDDSGEFREALQIWPQGRS